MKKVYLFIILFISTILVFGIQVNASEKESYPTWTTDANGQFTYTQTAYTPQGKLNKTDLTSPEDVYYKDGMFYIAESGTNSKITVLNKNGEVVKTIGLGILGDAKGVFVSHDDKIYVADKKNLAVYKFEQNGELLATYKKPTEPLFGKSNNFIPTKVVVDYGDNIYIIGEGSTNGIIQLNSTGHFEGYFGVNLSDRSLLQKIADIFVKDGEYSNTKGASANNIAINSKNTIFTSTPLATKPIKKLNTNGIDILKNQRNNAFFPITDIFVNKDDYIYAIDENNLVYEYDPTGNLVFIFDIKDQTGRQLGGLVQKATSIITDEENNLFIVDIYHKNIQMYKSTEFANTVHTAINLYYDGKYKESTELWQELLRKNNNFALAHSALGKAYYDNKEFDKALEEYKLAKNKTGYSESYWSIRDIWLRENLGISIIIIVSLFILIKILKFIDIKNGIFFNLKESIKKFKKRRFISEILLLGKMLRKPLDTIYEIKRQKASRYKTSIFILIVFFVMYLLSIYSKSFIYQSSNIDNISILKSAGIFFGIFFMWVFVNYLVSTISNGEGYFKDIFITSVYSLAPIIITLLPLSLFTNVLTLNESIIFQAVMNFAYIWTGILLFFSIKDVHNYEFGETIKNILLTLFGMAILSLILFIVYVFANQMFGFLFEVIKEVVNRVFN